MIALLGYWIHAFKLLAPKPFIRIVKNAATSYSAILFALLTKFIWFVVADLVIFILFGQHLLQFASSVDGVTRNAHPALLLLQLIAATIWSIINAVIFLLLGWQSSEESALNYIRRNFVRYLYFVCIWLSAALLFLVILVGLGISKLPSSNFPIVLIFTVVQLIVLQYWFDSDGTLQGVFNSFERGLNFLLYNLPILLFFMTMLWFTDFILTSIFIGGEYALNSGAIMLNSKVEGIMSDGGSWAAPFHFIAFKYCKIVAEYFWLSCIVELYKRFRHHKYARSLFDNK